MTIEFTDEHLSAFLDGQLDAETRVALEAQLERDVSLSKRLEALVQIDDRIRPAFGETISEQIPERFEHLLLTPTKDVGGLRWPHWLKPRFLAPFAAALVMGVAAGVTIGTSEPAAIKGDASGLLIADSTLGKALELTASGNTTNTALGPLKVRLTFVSRQGIPCRQFYLGRQEGIACRGQSAWTLDTLAPAPVDVFADDYQMVDGSVAEGIDAAIKRLGIETVLIGTDESDAIENEWKH